MKLFRAFFCLVTMFFTGLVMGQSTTTTVPAFPSSTIVTTSATASGASVATVNITFSHPQAVVTEWAALAKEGTVFYADFLAVQPVLSATNGIIAPNTHTRSYELGNLTTGTYKFIVRSRGVVQKEHSFTVATTNESPVPIAPMLTSSVTDPKAVSVNVNFQLDPRWSISAQSFRQETMSTGAKRFVLEATATKHDGPVIAVASVPISLNYALGSVAAGSHRLVWKLNGKAYAEGSMTVPSTPPVTPIANVSATFTRSAVGRTVAKVHIVLPDPYFAMTSVGSPVRVENRISINSKFDAIATLVALPAPGIVDQDYDLGELSPGTYRFVYSINETVRLDTPFILPPVVSTEPQLVSASVSWLPAPVAAGLTTNAGTWQASALVRALPDVAPTAEAFTKSGNVFTGPISLQPLDRFVGPDAVPVESRLVWNLGGTLSPGRYSFRAVMGTQVREASFEVVGTPLPPVRLALLDVHPDADGEGHRADVALLISDPLITIGNWGTPAREERVISVSATTTTRSTEPPILIDPLWPELTTSTTIQSGTSTVNADSSAATVPITGHIERYSYDLGTLPSGEYTFSFKLGTETLGQRRFVVSSTPPPPPVAVSNIEISSDDTSRWQAKVTIILPSANLIVTDWGDVTHDGQRHTANLTIGPRPTEAAGGDSREGDTITVDPQIPSSTTIPPTRPVVTHSYDLGLLEAGEHTFALQNAGELLATRFFVVGTIEPPPVVRPQLGFIEVTTGDASTVANIGVVLPQPGWSVHSWGEVEKVGSTFKVILNLDQAEVIPTVVLPPSLERHSYSLGRLEAGEYQFSVCYRVANSSTIEPISLGRRAFVVSVKPPPPPTTDPLPIVACLQPVATSAGSFVDVCLAFPRPGLEVKDWGTPQRTENAFNAALRIGRIDSTNPTTGGSGPTIGTSAGSNTPTPVDSTTANTFAEIGGWPTSLVNHRYSLGVLRAGRYVFALSVGDKVLARREFEVAPPTVVLPTITASAEPVRRASDQAARFTVTFSSPVGWEDPLAFPVTIKGPGEFTTEVTLTGGALTMDPLSRVVVGNGLLTGPGGSWDASDNGVYSINVDTTKVKDRNGNTVTNPTVGALRVAIVPIPPVTLPATLTTSMRDGLWFADVSFDNTGGWYMAEWTGPLFRGNVIAAQASLKVPDPWMRVMIPGSFSHTYELGELKPGLYIVTFTSSAGHLATGEISIPGIEPPTPLDAWKFNVFGAQHWQTSLSDDLADPDGDGASNLIEFALGTNPTSGTGIDSTAGIACCDAQNRFQFRIKRAAAARESVESIVEVSNDMDRWFSADASVEVVHGQQAADGLQEITATLTSPQWQFVRLRLKRR